MPITVEVVRVCGEWEHGYAAGDILLFDPGRFADALRKLTEAMGKMEEIL